MNDTRRWAAVVLYAIAMALVEAAVVAYLRRLVGEAAAYPSALTQVAWLARTEIPREAATLVMLAAVGWLAGGERRTRIGYFLLAFGIWDIFYYVFLVPLTGWPRSVLDWDILFLIPLPWWGPVLAPLSIAALMVAGGTLISQFQRADKALWPGLGASLAGLGGGLLALYVFMADALHAPDWSEQALRGILPTGFNWPLFALALALMGVPVLDLCRQLKRR